MEGWSSMIAVVDRVVSDQVAVGIWMTRVKQLWMNG